MSKAPDEPAVESQPTTSLDRFVGYQLRRASSVLLGDLARLLSAIDLTVAEASVLRLIADEPDITQSDLGRILGIQRANMAPLTAGLVERGLVERGRVDGRSQGLKVTEAGRRLADQASACMIAHEAQVLPELTGEERRALVTLLSRIWKNGRPA
jgi:DNA-binding MarR family transcriptional regulator